MSQLLPPKKEVAFALLERSYVDVYLDPRATGVVVPPQFRREPRLKLTIGLNTPAPTPDLRLDDETMSCTLSLGGTAPFFVVVPWPSIFAIVGDDGRGMVWPDDVPHELAVRMMEERPSATGSKSRSRGVAVKDLAEAEAKKARPKRPRKKKDEPSRPLLAVAPAEGEVSAAPEGRGKPRPRPALRVEPAPASGPAATAPQSGQPGDDACEAPAPAKKPWSPVPSRPVSRPRRELPPYLRVVK